MFQQSNCLQNLFHQQYYVINVCQYLENKDHGCLMRCNKQLREQINSYYKYLLKKNNLISSNHDQINYSQIFGDIYNRIILSTTFDIQEHDYPKSINIQRFSLFKDRGIKKFAIGPKFACFLLFDDCMIYCKEKDYLDQQLNQPEINSRQNVKDFSVIGRHLIYLDYNGVIHMIFYDDECLLSNMKEDVLFVTLSQPVKEFYERFTYLILIYQNQRQITIDPNAVLNNDQQDVFNESEQKILKEIKNIKQLKKQKQTHKETSSYVEQIDLPQKQQTKYFQQIGVLKIQNLQQVEQLNLSKNYKLIKNEQFEQLLNCCVGNQTAYYLDQNNKLYYTDFQNFDDEEIQMKIFDFFSNKNIQNIYSGRYFFFAVQRNDIEPFELWDNNQIVKWAIEIEELHDYVKIFKYENIKGVDLVNADNAFYRNRLGMKSQNLHRLIESQIKNCTSQPFQNQIVYGWGLNKNSQLGLASCFNTQGPRKIHLPLLQPNEKIIKIQCGWKQSCIVTDKNNFWLSRPMKKVEQSNEEAKQQRKNKQKVVLSKKEIKMLHQIENVRKKSSGQLRDSDIGGNYWIDLNQYFTQMKNHTQYRLIDVYLSNNIYFMGACKGKKSIKMSQFKIDEMSLQRFNDIGRYQFKSAEIIMNLIQIDLKYQHSNFKIQYQDQNCIQEINHTIFIQSQLNNDQIILIQLSGKTMWDKFKKIDHFY